MKKNFYYIILFCFSALSLTILIYKRIQLRNENLNTNICFEIKEKKIDAEIIEYFETKRITLLFAGDVMCHETQNIAAYNPQTGDYNYIPVFKLIQPIVENCDVAIANLETTISGAPYMGYPRFSTPDALLHALKFCGFTHLVNANNHANDQFKAGFERTIKMMEKLGFPRTGTFIDNEDRKKNTPLLIEKNGFRIGLLNYSYGVNGTFPTPPNSINYIYHKLISEDIAVTDSLNVDAKVVFMHWGEEYVTEPNENQKNYTDFCFQKGVDMVIGAHPHVIQPVEYSANKYFPAKNALVSYSLGNLTGNFIQAFTSGGIMLKVELIKKGDTFYFGEIGYFLIFVYKPIVNGLKQYYVLPASIYEDCDTLQTSEKQRLTQYITEARRIFKQKNMNIYEYIFDKTTNQWKLDSLQNVDL